MRSGYQKGKNTLVAPLSEKLLWFSVNEDCTLFTMGPRNLRLNVAKVFVVLGAAQPTVKGRVNWFLNFPRLFILPQPDKF